MNTPSIEIAWGGGKWPASFKRAARPWVQGAISLTRDVLEYMDVEYHHPKTVTVWCVGQGWSDSVASAEGVSDIELYLPYQKLRRNKIRHELTALTLSVLHETAHCIREESITQDNLLERVATEGVALSAERILAEVLFTPEEIARHQAEFNGEVPSEVEEVLMEALIDDAAYELYLKEEATPASEKQVDELYAAWFDGNDPTTLGAGSVLGLTAVRRLLDTDVPFNEVISLPTEDILTLPIKVPA